MQPGERVGAILSSKGDTVKFLGYGVYEGDFPYSTTLVPRFDQLFDQCSPEAQQTYANLRRLLNKPRIKLDSGKIVWGSECWFGSEAKVKERLAKAATIIHVWIDRDANSMPSDIVVHAIQDQESNGQN